MLKNGWPFITLPEDSLEFQQTFIQSCQAAGVLMLKPFHLEEAIRLEPSGESQSLLRLKYLMVRLILFRLTAANMLDAREHGAQVLTYHEVMGLIREGDRERCTCWRSSI